MIKTKCLVFLFLIVALASDYTATKVHAWNPHAGSGIQAQSPGGKPQKELPVVRLRSGPVAVDVEVARNFRERVAGLMFRRELPEGRGMIFVYSSDQVLGFWMRNTYIPLSIAYLCKDGVIQEIFHMEPMSVETVFSSTPVRFALEVPQGWFEKNGLKPGHRFEFPPGFPDPE